MSTTHEIPVGREPLSPQDVVAVARGGARVRITDDARKALTEGRERVRALAEARSPPTA